MLTIFAGAIGPVVVIPDPQWLGVALIGLYHTGAATLTLVLAIQLVGALYWGVEGRRDAWRARIGPAQAAGAARDVRAELLDAVGWLNRAVRAVLLIGLLLSFLTVTLRFFPGRRRSWTRCGCTWPIRPGPSAWPSPSTSPTWAI